MKGKRARARMIRAEALALSAMIATMNVMPALADTTIQEIGIESTKEDESGERNLASSSNATPVEEDNIDKEIETEENEEDTEEDFEFEEELENDLETEESTENEEDTESSESESLEDTGNESESSGAEESTEESTENLEESEKESSGDTENETEESLEDTENETEESTEDTESELETEEVDLEQVQVATPSNLEKPEELKPELMTLKEVVYGEWNDSEDGNWQFLPSEDGTCSIKPLSDAMKTGAVVIPEEVDGFTITSIGASAYESNINITSVVVPDSIKEIKEKAFKGTRITKFEANGVEKIETSAFNYCTGLITFNTHNAVELGDGVFTSCFSLKTVNIGASVIPFETFAHCEALTGFDFSNIEIIGERAFGWCEKLDTLELTNVKSIGEGAFTNCNFTSVDLTGIESIGNGAFGSNRELKTVKLTDVKNIGNYVFKNNKGITTLELTGIENIGNDAFSYCEGLTILKLTNVKSIGNQAFGHCEGLTTIELTDIESIGYRAFVSCTSLESVTLNNIGTIGDNTFQSCGGITDLNISNIGTIGDKAFLLCNSLITVNLNNVETIGVGAFQNLSSITSVTLDNVGTVGNSAFRKCTGLTELNIGSVGTIGGSVFNGCSSLTELEIESADTIETYAFYNCAALNNITIRSAGTIKESAVLAKESIHIGHADDIQGMIAKNITIDSAGTVYAGNNTCKKMGSSVGNDICERVTIGKAVDVKVYAKDEVFVGEADNIDQIKSGVTVSADGYSTEGKINKITIDKADTIHKISAIELDLGNIGEFTYSQALDGDKVNAYFRDNTTVEIISIDSVKEIPDDCFKFCSNLKNITIGHTDYIGDEAFKDCTALESISASVDNSIDMIGRYAFANCQSLKVAEFNNVGTIREYAFQDLQALNTLKIKDVGSIEKMAFHNCPSLEELTLGEIGTIGEEAFTLCDSLRTIKAGNVNEIGEAAFKQLKSLNSLTSGNIGSIGAHAFMKCRALETVNIGEVQNMGECAFAFCENLNTLNWTNNLKELPDFAFYKCGKLTSFDLGNVESIGVQALFKCNGIKELTVPASVDNVYLTDLPGEYDYSGKADFSRGYKLIFLGDNTDFQHFRSGDFWWCGWLNDKLNEMDDPEIGYVPAIDWRDSIIINEFVLPSNNSKAYKRMTDKNNTDTIPKIEGDSKKVLYHAVNNELRSNYINEFTSEETTEYHWSSFRTLPDIDGNDNQHVIIEVANVLNDNKENITITYHTNDGTENDIFHEDIGVSGEKAPDFTDKPQRENYEFTGWYTEPECVNEFDKETLLENSIDLYAKWEEKDTEDNNKEKITVTFWMNDGTDTIHKTEQIEKGGTVNTNDKPDRDRYEFTGWYTEPECKNRVTETTIFENDSDVYAGWKEKDTGSGSGGNGETDVKEKITITYYLNDGAEDIFKREQIEKGDSPDMSVEPSRKGYEFTGWYYEAECENRVPDDITVEEDTDFYAGWEKKNTGGNGGSGGEIPDNPDDKKEPIKVTYYENDGTPDIYKTEKIEKGDTPDTSGEPEREGYEFIGWYEDPDCKIPVDPSKPLNEDTEYYAGWKKKDTDPSGNGSGSDKPEDDKKPDDKPDNKPEDKVEKVKVTYHTNDDTDKIYKEEEIEKGGTPDTEGNPDRDKYEFTGWYLDPECKVPVDPSKPLDEDTDLYAGWKKKDTIPTGNGSHGGGGSYSGGSSTVTVVNVHEDKPEPGRTTIGENGVPQGDTDKEEVNTYALDENGVPRDRAEEEKDKLPKTGDKRNILVYWITFMSSLSSIMFMGLKDKIRIRASKEKTENEIKH